MAGATLAWSLAALRREHAALVRREADALRMAELDDLTGLGNYRMFMRALAAEVARSRRYEDPFSLVLLDLDGFKAINDELGHLAGDDALRLVAVALRDALREEDVCCRQGGDEFAVIAVRAGDEEASELAERLTRAIAAIPFGADGERRLGASIGWATFGQPARSVDELILRADTALRQTKRANGGALRDGAARGASGGAGSAREGRARAGAGVSATNRLALLAGLARALPSARDERALAETTVAFLAGAFDTVGTAVAGLDHDGGVRLAALSSGDDRADAIALLGDLAVARRALAAAGPAVVEEDVEAWWVDGARVRSELAVAILDETRTWGWLVVASDRPHAYGLAERALAEAIAEQLGRALTCRRLLDRLREAGFGELYRVAVGSAAAAGTESWRIAELAWQTGRRFGTRRRGPARALPRGAVPRRRHGRRAGGPALAPGRAARRGARGVARARADRRADAARPAAAARGGADRPPRARALRRHRLPGPARGRGDPGRLADPARVRRVRLDDLATPVAAGALDRLRARRAAARRRLPARPARRRRAARRARGSRASGSGVGGYASASSATRRSCDSRSCAVHAIGVTISVPTPASR